MAAVFTVLLLLRTGKLPKLRGMSRVTLGLIVLSIAGLCGNYICFLLGLDRMTAASAQIVIQLGPLFLLLGSLVVFREAFSWRQGVGVVVFVIGLLLFFNQRMDQLFDGGSVYGFGALLIVVASASWSIYALAQKQLLRTYSSTQILLILYLAAVVVYTPTAKPAGILELNGFQLFLLLFTGANVIVAYGCFTEAMAHWEASRVSAVLAMVPLVTLAAVEFCEAFVPWLARSEGLNALGWLGALMVVGGSMQCALGRKKEKKSELGELAPGE